MVAACENLIRVTLRLSFCDVSAHCDGQDGGLRVSAVDGGGKKEQLKPTGLENCSNINLSSILFYFLKFKRNFLLRPDLTQINMLRSHNVAFLSNVSWLQC